MSDLDKDIENLEKYIFLIEKDYCDECNELNVISYGKHCNGSRNVANSMKNVLSELEIKDQMINLMADRISEMIEKLYDGKYKRKDVIEIFRSMAVSRSEVLKDE